MTHLQRYSRQHNIFGTQKIVTFIRNFEPENHYIEIINGSRTKKIIKEKGHANIIFKITDGKSVAAKLEIVL